MKCETVFINDFNREDLRLFIIRFKKNPKKAWAEIQNAAAYFQKKALEKEDVQDKAPRKQRSSYVKKSTYRKINCAECGKEVIIYQSKNIYCKRCSNMYNAIRLHLETGNYKYIYIFKNISKLNTARKTAQLQKFKFNDFYYFSKGQKLTMWTSHIVEFKGVVKQSKISSKNKK